MIQIGITSGGQSTNSRTSERDTAQSRTYQIVFYGISSVFLTVLAVILRGERGIPDSKRKTEVLCLSLSVRTKFSSFREDCTVSSSLTHSDGTAKDVSTDS